MKMTQYNHFICHFYCHFSEFSHILLSADSYGDKREAGGIEEDVDDRPQIIVHSTEPESHLQHILYRQSYQGSNDHPSRTLIPLVLPSYMQMRECYDEGIDEHEYKTCKLK